jgi:SAM-dependent methyltransferase
MHVNSCPVCQSELGVPHLVREMMLGTREEFLYFECSECGCLSLAETPSNLDRYSTEDQFLLERETLSMARKFKDSVYLSRLSFLVNWRRRADLDLIRRVQLTKDMNLLDVGCGSGRLLGELRELGYKARGVDPSVPADVQDRFGIRVERKTLAEVTDSFDVILFRHSLELLPIDMLKLAREHINKDGSCVACIPLASWAWRAYATDWAQLNAPRHLLVHSSKSFSLLSEKSGFRIERVIFDSTEFQFWASDSYQRDIPLAEMIEPTRSQRSRMRRLAAVLNLREQGDTAQFYLKPA